MILSQYQDKGLIKSSSKGFDMIDNVNPVYITLVLNTGATKFDPHNVEKKVF